MYQGFRPLDKNELKKIKGGWMGVAAFVAMMVPLVINALTQSVAAIKMIKSDNGSVKYQGYESKWESPTSKAKSITNSETKTFVYAY